MIKMSTKNVIEVLRGNDKTIIQTIYESDGVTEYDLAGCTVKLYVKRNIKDDNDDAIITLSGAISTPTTDGEVKFYILPAHTNSDEAKANLKDDKYYPYEVEVITADATPKYYTATRSTFMIQTQNR